MNENTFFGPVDPVTDAGYVSAPPRKGFFTDTSVCIGCKACEVACKEWNGVPDDGFTWLGSSYDNTGSLGASTWRHVAFIEQPVPQRDSRRSPVDLGMPSMPGDGSGVGVVSGEVEGAEGADGSDTGVRWLMSSDVCKHCTHSACLDVCPTGALFRTEFGTVVVQDDVCNGCGYCVPACPFGVIERRKGPEGVKNVGIAQKCTLCYDRLGAGLQPACATACPTQSIQYGDLDELRDRAHARVDALHERGVGSARLYLDDPEDGIGGGGSLFLLLDEPEVYGLPPDPVVTTKDLRSMFHHASAAAGVMILGAVVSFAGRRLGGRR